MAGPHVVHVYLLDVEPTTGRWGFHAEAARDEDEASSRHRGFRGWFEAKAHALHDGWQHANGPAARSSRRAWEWLQRRTHRDEPLLARLRTARSIAVHYPPAVNEDEAVRAWSTFLAEGRRRHRVGFLGHALVAPLSVALAPLPGPNLLGYWFVYRAVRHWLILVGLGRVRRGLVATSFRTVDAVAGSLVEK